MSKRTHRAGRSAFAWPALRRLWRWPAARRDGAAPVERHGAAAGRCLCRHGWRPAAASPTGHSCCRAPVAAPGGRRSRAFWRRPVPPLPVGECRIGPRPGQRGHAAELDRFRGVGRRRPDDQGQAGKPPPSAARHTARSRHAGYRIRRNDSVGVPCLRARKVQAALSCPPALSPLTPIRLASECGARALRRHITNVSAQTVTLSEGI